MTRKGKYMLIFNIQLQRKFETEISTKYKKKSSKKL